MLNFISRRKITLLLLAVFFSALAFSQTNYYSKSTGDLDDLTTWGTVTDGSGANPANFTTNNSYFNIRNRMSATVGANWVVTGTTSRVIVGDGLSSCEFIIPAAFSLTGTGARMYLSALSTLTIQNATNPTMVTLNANSTVVYDGTGAQTVAAATYGDLTVSNARAGANVTFSGAINLVGSLTLSATGVGAYVTTGSTINYSAPGGGQIILSLIPYNNLSCGSGAGTNTTDGDLSVAGALVIANSSTLNLGTNRLLTTASMNIGTASTLSTQYVGTLAIPSGLSIAGTGAVLYDAPTGGQTVVQETTYGRLSIGNTSGVTTPAGDLVVASGLTANAGAVLDMGTNKISGALTSNTINGTLRTAYAGSDPLTTGKTWAGTGTVEYYGSGAQTVVAGTYSGDLTISGARAGSAITFEAGTVAVAGLFSLTATGVGSFITTGNTFNYTTTAGGRTILSAIPYNNLGVNNTSGTNTADGTITVNGTLTTTTGGTFDLTTFGIAGTLSVITNNGTISTASLVNPPLPLGRDWSGTTGRVIFASTTGGQSIPTGTYKAVTSLNTSGTNTVVGGDLTVTGTIITSGIGGTLDMGTNALTALTINNLGTTLTQNTSANPLSSGKTWGGTLNYNGTGAQTMVTGTFTNLALSGARVGSPAITLENGAINCSGNFSVTATGIGSFSTGTNTFTYTGNTNNILGGITYNNLTLTNTSTTKTADGDVVVNGALTTASGGALAMSGFVLSGALTAVTNNGTISTLSTNNPALPIGKDWSGTTGRLNFLSVTGGQFIPAGTCKTLACSNTSGTNTVVGGDLIISATATTTPVGAGILDMGTNALSATVISNNGTIKTQNTSSNPLPSGKTWNGTVEYNGAGAQTMVTGTFVNLALSGNHASGDLTLENGAISLSGNFAVTATNLGSFITGTNSFTYTANGSNTVGGITYNNLSFTNTAGTKTADGNVGVNGALLISNNGTVNMSTHQLSGAMTSVTHNGTLITSCTVNPAIPSGKDWSATTGRVTFANATGGQFVPGGTYRTLTCSNTSGVNTVVSGDLNILGTITTSSLGGTLDMGVNQLTAITITNTGTLKTSNTGATPLPSGKTWAGTVDYYATTGGQRVMGGTYNGLTLSNSSGTTVADGAFSVTATLSIPNAGATLDMGTFAMAGTLTSITNNGTITTANTTATPFTTGKTWGGTGTVIYNVPAGSQTVMAGTYNNLTLSNTSGVNTASASLTVNGTLTTTAGGIFDFNAVGSQLLGATIVPVNNGTIRTVCTVNPAIPSGETWGGTVIFNRTTGAQFVPGGTYDRLFLNNTSATNTAVGAISVISELQTTSGGTLAMGLNQLSGTITTLTNDGTITTTSVANPALPSGRNWSGTTGLVSFAATTGNQFIPAGTYKTLTCANTSNTNTATGNLTVTTAITTSAAGGTLDMGTNLLSGAFTPTNTGTLKTQNTSADPITSGKTWVGTVNFNNATGGQTISQGTYSGLTLDNTSGTTTAGGDLSLSTLLTVTNAGGTLNMSAFAMSGTMTTINNAGTIRTSNTSSLPFTAGRTWAGTGTVMYDVATGGQTVVTGTYANNLTLNNTSGINTAGGSITANAGLTTTVGGTLDFISVAHQLLGATIVPVNNGTIRTICTVSPAIPAGEIWAGSIIYDRTAGGQTIPAGTYSRLFFNNNSGTNTATGVISVASELQTTSGGTLAMVLNQLTGTITTLTNNGTITTTSVADPAIPSGRDWTGTTGVVSFAATTGNQFIPAGTFKTLTCLNTSNTNTVRGNIAVSTAFTTSAAGGTLDMASNLLTGAFVPTNSGTLKTQNTSGDPITSGKTWIGTVNFNNLTGGQTISQGTYSGIALNNTSGTTTAGGNISLSTLLTVANAGATLNMSTFAMSGTMTGITNAGTIRTSNTSSLPFTAGRTWAGAGTVIYDVVTGGQTVVAGTYANNLTLNNTSGINTASGSITANAGLTTTAGGTLDFISVAHQLLGATIVPVNNGTIRTICTVSPAIPTGKTWGGTIVYDRLTGGQSLPVGTYNNLNLKATSGTVTATGAITVNGTLTTASNGTLAMGNFQLLGTLTSLTHNGTINTTCTVDPAIPSGKDWSGTGGTSLVVFSRAAGGQFIPTGTYKALTCQNTSNTNTAVGGDITVTGVIVTTSAGGTMDMGVNALAAGGVTNSGTTKTQNTSASPLPSGFTWAGTVDYNGTGAQTMVNGTFVNLALSGARTGSPVITLENGAINVSGNFSVTATGIGSYSPGTNTFTYTGNTSNSVGGITYNNLSFTNTLGTKTANGNITVNGALLISNNGVVAMGTNTLGGAMTSVTHNGTLTTLSTNNPAITSGKNWSGTTGRVTFAATTGGQFIPTGTYRTLTCANTSNTNTAVGGNLTVLGTFTTAAAGGTLNMGTNDFTANLITNSGTIRTQSTSATPMPSAKTIAGTVRYDATGGGQTIIQETAYLNLALDNTAGTNTAAGNLVINGTFADGAAGTILDMTTFTFGGTLTGVSGSGLLKTANTSATPIKTGVTWTMPIEYYNATGGQTIMNGTYNSGLLNSNTSGTNTVAALSAITVNGNLTLSAGSEMSDNDRTVTVNGNITGTGTHNVSASGKITVTGTAATISAATLGNLYLDNAAGFSLAGDLTVNGTLTLSAGQLAIGSNNLILGTTAATIAGSPSVSNMILTAGSGQVRKLFSGTGSYLFPVGKGAAAYTPITLNLTSGTFSGSSYVGVNVKNVTQPNNINTTDYLNRYWRVNVANITTPVYSITATYVPADVVGTEGNIAGGQYGGSLPWLKFATVNTGAHSLSATGITDANSDFTGISEASPTVSILPATSSFCSGGSVGLTATGAGDPALTYSWAPSTGLSATTGASVTAAPTTPFSSATEIVYTVTITDGNGFTSTSTATVTVNPLAHAGTITGAPYVNVGSTTALSVSGTAGGAWVASNSNASVDGSGLVSGLIVGTTVISYTHTNSCGSDLATRIVTVNVPGTIACNETWSNVAGSGFTPGVAGFTSLAFYGNTPYVAYQDGANGSRASVMRQNGSVWEQVGIPGFSAGQALYLSLAFDGSTPYVAYRDGGNGLKSTVMKFNGSTWENVGTAGFSAGTANYISLALDGSTPYVAYSDGGNSNGTTVMKYNGSSWVTVGTPGFSLGWVSYTSLALDGSTPYVAYRDDESGTKATVMKFNGVNWVTVGTPGFSAGQAEYTSLALDGSTPYVAYADGGNGFKASVMKFNGAAWVAVGSAGLTAGQAFYTSLKFAGGTPYLAYRDGGNSNKASVKSFNGSSWGTVGNAGFSAGGMIYPSVAFDTDGKPFVAYMDGVKSNKATVMAMGDAFVGPITGTASVCAGATTTLSNTISDGTWSSGSIGVATVGSTGVVTGVSGGTAVITLIAYTGCFTTTEVTVNAKPTIGVSASTSICSGASIGLTATGAATYTWSPSVGLSGTTGSAVTATPTVTTIYTVTGTSSLTCTNTASMNVTVNAIPTVGVSPGSAICNGASTGLTATGAVTYTWTPAAGLSATTGSTVTATPTITTTYTVTGTGSLTCTNTAVVTVTVNALPTVGVSASTAICPASSAGLTATGAVTYSWSPSVGLSATTGSTVTATPTITTTYTVTGTGSLTCTNTAVVTVTVNALPTVGVSASTAICPASSAGLTATGAVTYTWSPAEGLSATTGSSVTASPTVTTTYTVSGTSAGGCTNIASTTVSVNASPTVGVSASADICIGAATGLTATGAASYTWSPSAGLSATTGSSVTASPTITTTYTVTGTSIGSCANTNTVTVTVNDLPTVGVSASSAICNGASTGLSATGGVTYSWSPSVGLSATTGSSVTATPTITTTYTVTGTSSLSCTNTAVVTVTVNALPTVGVSASTGICDGSSTGLAATGAVSYTWSPSAGLSATTGSSVTATPTITTTYTVTGTNAPGCVNTASVTITVNSIPTVNVSPSIAICSGGSAGLTATGAATYSWSPSTGLSATTGASVTASPTVTTTYTVTGVGAGGCSGTALVTVSVNPLPNAGILTGAGVVNEGASIFLNTTGTAGGAWSSSNANASVTGGTVSGVTAGTAIISYAVTNGCGTAFAEKSVTVNSIASPITGVSILCSGATTTYAHSFAGGTWSSSNTGVLTINVTSGFATAVSVGVATITYVNGATTVTKDVTVSAAVPAITGTATMCQGSMTTLSNALAGGTWSSSFTWNATVDVSTGVVTGVAAGVSFITYAISPICYSVQTVTVNPLPSTITGTLALCVTGTVTLSSATTGGTWFSDNVAKATINGTTGLVTGISIGTANITYTSASGCMRKTVVTVNASLGSITGESTVCVGQTIATLVSPGGSGTWSSASTSVATINAASGILTGIGSGTVTISYTTSTGCYATIVATVNAAVSNITGGSSVCVGAGLTMDNLTGGGTWSSSNTYKATIDPGTGVVTALASGTTTISYIVTTGCYQTTNITINTGPGAISGNSTVCEGSTTNLTVGLSGGTWSSSATGNATIGSSTGVVTGVTATGTTTISYILPSGCFSTKTMTVDAAAGAITGTATACISGNTTLSCLPGGGTWSSGTVSKATINSSTGEVTGVAAGTSRITYTATGGCTSYVIVTVSAAPSAITGILTMCVGSTTSLGSATFSQTWSSADVTKATVNASTGVVTAIASGTSMISYTNAAGCASTAVVTVNAGVTAITGTALTCVGQNISGLANPTSGGTWTSSSTAIATVHPTSGLLTGVSGGNATITYRTSTACFTTTVATVNAAIPAITGTTALCASGGTSTLANSTAGGAWSSSNTFKATVDAGGVVTGVGAGTATISYVVSAGCYKVTGVTVNSLPAPISGSASVVKLATTTLTSFPGTGAWSSSDGLTATVGAGTGVVNGVELGAATITYTLPTGCSVTRAITVVASRPGMPTVAEPIKTSQFALFPNPTSGSCTINSSVAGTLSVYAVDGRQITEFAIVAGTTNIVLPSELAAGVYMCRFDGDDKVSTVIRLWVQP